MSSVALAHLLAEDRFPPDDLWQRQLVSSRLLEYEVWHARRLDQSHGDAVRALIGRVALLELATPVLARGNFRAKFSSLLVPPAALCKIGLDAHGAKFIEIKRVECLRCWNRRRPNFGTGHSRWRRLRSDHQGSGRVF